MEQMQKGLVITSSNHDAGNATHFKIFFIVFKREDVTIAEDRHRAGCLNAFSDIIPILETD